MDRTKTEGSFTVVFGKISSYPNELRSDSATYKVAGHSWYLALFPGSDTPTEIASPHNIYFNNDNCRYISCWVLCKSSTPVRASCCISVLGINGAKQHFQKGPATTFLDNSGWKCSKFFTRNYFGNLTINDTLTILVEMTVYGPLEEFNKFTSCVPSKTFMDDVKHLFFDTTTTDVCIVASSKRDGELQDIKSMSDVKDAVGPDLVEKETIKIPAHKFILSMRSPVFRTMFASGMAEATSNEVLIQDFDAAVLTEFVRFLYTDQCELEQLAEQLLAAAFKYEVPGLHVLCEDYLGATVRVGNVVNILYLSDLYTLEHLQLCALRCIAEHPKEVVQTDLTLHVVQAGLSPELSQRVLHALAGTVQSK